jgi:twitching motility protein PilT
MLFPEKSGEGLVPAVEIMLANPGIRRAIRDSETHLIPGMIEMGRASGMRTMDESILELVSKGRITRQMALARAQSPERMSKYLAA